MGSKYEFDDTRDAIGTSNLSNDERKAMLDKFKGAGGKILSEKELKNQLAATGKGGQTSRPAGGGGHSSALPSEMRKEQRRQEMSVLEQRQLLDKQNREKMSSGSVRFFLKLKCFMSGISPFLQLNLKSSFLELITHQYKSALMELQVLTNELFSRDPKTTRLLIHDLDNKNPLLVEILEYIQSMFKEIDFSKFQEYHNDNNHVDVPFSVLSEQLRYTFKKIYYLYAYQETARKTFNFAIDFIKEKSSIDDVSKSRIEGHKKKFSKDLGIIFQNIFSRLFLAISCMDGMEYPPFSPYLEKAIGAADEERLGKREKGASVHLATSSDDSSENEDGESEGESGDEEKEEKETSKIAKTKEYEYGFKLMTRIPPPELRKKHDPKNNFDFLKIYDKVFLSYLYFLEFDHEYSFVLTTNKINYNIDYTSGVKIDHKKIMADVYNDSRGIAKAFENYVSAKKELDKVKTNKLTNYINQSKLETSQENKINVESRNTRGLIRKYMDEVAINLAKIIADTQNENKILANLDEAVKFNKELEGDKRLNGYKVSETISETYSYAVALRERLTNGDLYGGIIEMTKEEMTEIYGAPYGYES